MFVVEFLPIDHLRGVIANQFLGELDRTSVSALGRFTQGILIELKKANPTAAQNLVVVLVAHLAQLQKNDRDVVWNAAWLLASYTEQDHVLAELLTSYDLPTKASLGMRVVELLSSSLSNQLVRIGILPLYIDVNADILF